MRFKIGDKVKVIKNSNPHFKLGETFEITNTGFLFDGTPLYCKFDGHSIEEERIELTSPISWKEEMENGHRG